jgi:hypothetical protein
VLFGEQSPASLAAAIEHFERLDLSERRIRENAGRFGRQRFRTEMADVIERASGEVRARGGSASGAPPR